MTDARPARVVPLLKKRDAREKKEEESGCGGGGRFTERKKKRKQKRSVRHDEARVSSRRESGREFERGRARVLLSAVLVIDRRSRDIAGA